LDHRRAVREGKAGNFGVVQPLPVTGAAFRSRPGTFSSLTYVSTRVHMSRRLTRRSKRRHCAPSEAAAAQSCRRSASVAIVDRRAGSGACTSGWVRACGSNLEHHQRLVAPRVSAPRCAKGRVIIEAVGAGIVQIRGPALRLIRGAVAPDHDLACFRAPHAIDRVQGDAVRGLR